MSPRGHPAARVRHGVRVFRKGEAAATPLYLQVYAQLAERIRSGALVPGARLPSSRQLAQDLRVARNTVEGALARLVAEGLVERRVGSGTRVAIGGA